MKFLVTKDLAHSTLLSYLMGSVVFAILMYLGFDMVLHAYVIGLDMHSVSVTLFGDAENFVEKEKVNHQHLDFKVFNENNICVSMFTAIDSSENNGGKTDYYQLASSPFPINDADDFAEWRGMNFFQGNILKVVWTFNTGRHSGTDQIRDLNKIIHYANREKERIEREDNLQ